MVTVAHLVKRAVQQNEFLLEAMAKDLVSYGNLAALIKPEIEKEFGSPVKDAAVVMALRRYADGLSKTTKRLEGRRLPGEILMRTNIIDINVLKTPVFSTKIKDLYKMVDVEHGDVFNVILGNNEACIITNEKYRERLMGFLKGESVLTKQQDLVAITLRFSSKDFLTTPGVIFSAVRRLAWESINIYEIVSTITELTVIIHKRDSMKAYTVLQEVVAG
ncbi:TPA: hypothetical protein HA280_02105 [Candidatus Woesearchaeota archaeon]|nr:hypothetical protein [Candidatus Woesearchaeota archaeon]